MSQFTAAVGGVMSADIAVPEHDLEIRFYSRVLTTGTTPLWREDLMNNVGIPIIGLGAQSPQYADLPLQWMPHMQVADVAISASRAAELGGRELMHHRDADGNSQWAVLVDRDGAAFGIIPVVPAEALPPIAASEQPMGRIAWLDLSVPDASASRDFYAHVIGWTVDDVPMREGSDSYADHLMLGANGAAAAGVCHARGPNATLPPVWLLYLPVADLAESLRRVEEEGGTVLKVSHGKDGSPTYAVIRDPVGAHVALMPVK